MKAESYFSPEECKGGDDITFCASDCARRDCARHRSNMRSLITPRGFAWFGDSCADYAPEATCNKKT